jgi:hypothetical protein
MFIHHQLKQKIMETLVEPGQSEHSDEVEDTREQAAINAPMPDVMTHRTEEEILKDNATRDSLSPTQIAQMLRKGGHMPDVFKTTKDGVDVRLQDKEK